jgi:hypothetical protein
MITYGAIPSLLKKVKIPGLNNLTPDFKISTLNVSIHIFIGARE